MNDRIERKRDGDDFQIFPDDDESEDVEESEDDQTDQTEEESQ